MKCASIGRKEHIGQLKPVSMEEHVFAGRKVHSFISRRHNFPVHLTISSHCAALYLPPLDQMYISSLHIRSNMCMNSLGLETIHVIAFSI